MSQLWDSLNIGATTTKGGELTLTRSLYKDISYLY